VGRDWPISYDDLRPYYAKVEREFGVAGECGPFAPEPYQLPMPPHRMNWHAQVLARREKIGRAAVCSTGRDQFGRVRWPAGLHLLRVVRIGMRDWGESYGIADLFSQS